MKGSEDRDSQSKLKKRKNSIQQNLRPKDDRLDGKLVAHCRSAI